MERTRTRPRWRTLLIALGAAIAALLMWDVAMALLTQLLAASLMAGLALPLCRALERRIPAGAASALALILIGVGAVLLLMLMIPPLVAQLSQLTHAIPGLVEGVQHTWQQAEGWLRDRGVDAAPLRDGLFRQITQSAGGWLSGMVAGVTRFATGLGRVLLSPLLAFYLLRDRRRFAIMALLALPPARRDQAFRTACSIRRELGAYVRGQLTLSMAVGGMTAIALLIAGTPAWLLLGLLMGVMELVPYIGPFLAGLPAVLLSLQGGWLPALWALIALLCVQQIDAAFLSPRLLGNAMKLHPLAVLLLISAAGMAAGPLGMLLILPITILVRSLWRERRSIPPA